MTEKAEMAKPAQKGVNPIPGLFSSPTPWLIEAIQKTKPQINQNNELHWSLFNRLNIISNLLNLQYLFA
jgi:hypothetical protein